MVVNAKQRTLLTTQYGFLYTANGIKEKLNRDTATVEKCYLPSISNINVVFRKQNVI